MRITHFNEVHNISLRWIQRESNNVDPITAKQGKKYCFFCQWYEFKNLFNAEVTGLYLRVNFT